MSDITNFPDYPTIKAMARALKRPAHTLYALSDARDPFYITPARLAGAEWFARIWALLDPPNGVHLRRLHYRLVSLPDAERPRKVDGSAYVNTEHDWNLLSDGSVDARALGLVDADKFTDRRAGEPIFVADDRDAEPKRGAMIGGYGAWLDDPPKEAAFFVQYFPKRFELPELPDAYVAVPEFGEPYAIEVWVEKSTANDILEPLARRLNFTLITGVGEISWTHCVWHVQRVLRHRKKARILYISDFDPSGARMPTSIARKIEFLLRRDGHDLDVRLEPIALTIEQVQRFRLPRIPIKDSDAGKKDFEDRFGEGAVELDALEALVSGELARIVEAEVAFYRRPTRRANMDNLVLAMEIRAQIQAARAEVIAEHESEIGATRAAFDQMLVEIAVDQEALAAIAEDATARSQAHVTAINSRVSNFYEGARDLWRRIGAALAPRLPDAEDFAWVEPEPPDAEEEPLFDSSRGYVEQIGFYKQRTGRPMGRRGNGNGGAP
jgi:hypothetical protein